LTAKYIPTLSTRTLKITKEIGIEFMIEGISMVTDGEVPECGE